MTYRYIGEGRTIAGVPAEDLSDEDFAAYEAKLDAQFSAKGSLSTCQHPQDEREPGHACLLFERVDEKKRAAPAGSAAESEE